MRRYFEFPRFREWGACESKRGIGLQGDNGCDIGKAERPGENGDSEDEMLKICKKGTKQPGYVVKWKLQKDQETT